MDKTLNIYHNNSYISVSKRFSQSKLGILEISNVFNDNNWYINRINIPIEFRSNNIGSRLLHIAKIILINVYNCNSIYVTPGGYNMDRDKQFNFYIRNGFISYDDFENKELFYYKNLNKPII